MMNNDNTKQKDEITSPMQNKAEKYLEGMKTDKNVSKILEAIGGIGTEEQLKAGESLEALKKPVSEMMNNPNHDLPEQLSKLKNIVAELEPNYLKEGKIKRFFSKIVRKSPIEKYAQKYQTIESEVETVIGALLNGKDRLQEDTVMLHQLKEIAIERIDGLNEQIDIGKQLNLMLEEELTKEEWQNDPSPIQKGQQKVLSR